MTVSALMESTYIFSTSSHTSLNRAKMSKKRKVGFPAWNLPRLLLTQCFKFLDVIVRTTRRKICKLKNVKSIFVNERLHVGSFFPRVGDIRDS